MRLTASAAICLCGVASADARGGATPPATSTSVPRTRSTLASSTTSDSEHAHDDTASQQPQVVLASFWGLPVERAQKLDSQQSGSIKTQTPTSSTAADSDEQAADTVQSQPSSDPASFRGRSAADAAVHEQVDSTVQPTVSSIRQQLWQLPIDWKLTPTGLAVELFKGARALLVARVALQLVRGLWRRVRRPGSGDPEVTRQLQDVELDDEGPRGGVSQIPQDILAGASLPLSTVCVRCLEERQTLCDALLSSSVACCAFACILLCQGCQTNCAGSVCYRHRLCRLGWRRSTAVYLSALRKH
jgi:hypothetical protein